MISRSAHERHCPARPGRSPGRAVLSRPPRWLTSLGIVLLLGELASAAALLAAGATGVPRTAARRVPHGGGSASTVPYSGTRTVALKVTGVGMPPNLEPQGTACRPSCDPHQPGVGGPVDYTTPAGSVDVDPALPFTTTVRVPAGGAVTLQASPWLNAYGVAYQVTCSILLNGRVLSRETSNSQNPVTCRVKIP